MYRRPPPSWKIGRGVSPDFYWGRGDVCTQAKRTLQLAFWPSITEILPALPNLWEIIVDLNLWWEFVKFVYTSVANPGEGPGGFRPNRGPKGRKNFFGRPPPAPLSNGLDLVNVLGQTICVSLVLWKVTPVYVGFRKTGVESNICWFSFLPTSPIINRQTAQKWSGRDEQHFFYLT